MKKGDIEQQEIDVAFVLNHMPYLDVPVPEGWKLGEYIDYIDGLCDHFFLKDTDEYQVLKAACETKPELRNLEIVDYSKDPITPNNVTDDMVQGITFYDRVNDTYYISFRGTGNGRWPDNAVQINRLSEMDQAAADYVDDVVEKLNLAEQHENGCRINVTGHSKGGHNAQLAFLHSENAAILDNCYSFDGHGTGKEVVESFKERTDYQYDEKIKHMYSINGDNDPVNHLGEVIVVPEENRYYLKLGDPAKDIMITHFLSYIGAEKGDGGWVYTDGIHWDTTEDGTILNGEPGPYGEFARKLNEYLFTLDPEDREGAAKYAMYLIDYFYGSPYTIGSENPDWTDWVDLCANGLPVILYTVLFTEEGRDLLMQYLPGFLSAIYERYGICGYVGTAIGVAIVGVFVFDVIVFAKIMDFFIDFYDNVVVKVCGTIHNWAKSTIENIKSFAVKAYQKAKEWYESRTEAGRYASDHPQIVVDTKALGSYATRLNVVNNRLAALDKRMDSLYGRVGWLDLWNLLRADLLTGKSKTLKKCISYLRDTQTSFENVENELKSI